MSHPYPVRVQRRRVKGWRLPPNTVCVDRSTRFGNPFRVTYDRVNRWCVVTTEKRWYCSSERVARRFSVWKFRRWASNPNSTVRHHMDELRGKNVACFCRLDRPCHGDVLLEIANR